MRDVARGLVEAEGKAGELEINAVQIISPLLQLYPEVEVRHADDASDLPARALQGACTWIFAGSTVYLACPVQEAERCAEHARQAPHSSCMRILRSKHVAPLLQHYLKTFAPANRAGQGM